MLRIDSTKMQTDCLVQTALMVVAQLCHPSPLLALQNIWSRLLCQPAPSRPQPGAAPLEQSLKEAAWQRCRVSGPCPTFLGFCCLARVVCPPCSNRPDSVFFNGIVGIW